MVLDLNLTCHFSETVVVELESSEARYLLL